jgi:hypothetical protein
VGVAEGVEGIAVQSLEGDCTDGSRIVTVAVMKSYEVTELERDRMTWSGGMPLGLFKGVRTYRVAPEDGGTRFTMREEYSGPLLPLIWRSMPDLQPSFDRFARGLKARVESSV